MSQASAVNGKVIAITGGARGIGLATAKMVHRLGAKVATGDVDEAAVKESVETPRREVVGRTIGRWHERPD